MVVDKREKGQLKGNQVKIFFLFDKFTCNKNEFTERPNMHISGVTVGMYVYDKRENHGLITLYQSERVPFSLSVVRMVIIMHN